MPWRKKRSRSQEQPTIESSIPRPPSSACIDKEYLHGLFNQSVRTSDLIRRKWSDIPIEDDMQIDNSRHYYGGEQGSPIVSIVKAALLAAGIGTAGWFASTMVRPDAEQVTPAEDTNTRYELRFD